MSIRWRLVGGFGILCIAGFWYLMHWVGRELRPRYLEAVEESLVETAWLLAGQVAAAGTDGTLRTETLGTLLRAAQRHPPDARIYDLRKRDLDLEIYVTDSLGKVVFDSRGGRAVGEDFSRWRDVHLTLNGKYGARSTRRDPDDPATSELHVAAPIRVEGRILGVLTVVKPSRNVDQFIAWTRRKILWTGGIAALAVFLLVLSLTLWVTNPIQGLIRYARAAGEGRAPPRPRWGRNEMGEVGRALEEMREALEGKKYVEQYVQTFTHEIKSPLAAIRGAAELLEEEEMAPDRRAKFIANIRNEAARITRLVDRMLGLSVLENRREIVRPEAVDLKGLLETCEGAWKAMAAPEGVQVTLKIREPGPFRVSGDLDLLRQALENLVRNAVEFAPAESAVEIELERSGDRLEVRIRDRGPGIPDWALPRIFDKFYSLARPRTGRKSTGLGLSFVAGIARLHEGTLALDNHPAGGALARFGLPAAPA